MRLGDALHETSKSGPESVRALAHDLTDEVILKACELVGYKDMRKRRLPIEILIWVIIGMALFRNRAIEAVASHLKLWQGEKSPGSGAIALRREAVGQLPIQAIFEYTAKEWAVASAKKNEWRGLSLFAVDGVCLRVADSLTNEAHFGRPSSPENKNQSGYPQLRMAGLMALRSHLLLGVAFGPYREGETTLARLLWPLLVDHSLVILDKGFNDFALFHHLTTSGAERHFLARAKQNLKFTEVERLGPWDYLIDIEQSWQSRQEDPTLPRTTRVRLVTYQRNGFKVQRLMTSLLDPKIYPASEIRSLYHERWEIELGWDEVKTHTLDQEESLRSKSPELVAQEVWGLCLAYNLVRKQMERFADEHKVSPNQISYRNALLIIQNTCISAATGVGSLAKLIAEMNANFHLVLLPERRDRIYPRHVKLKMKKYKRNPGRSLRKPTN